METRFAGDNPADRRLPSGWETVLAPDMPIIVCLCGSTRFYQAFQEAAYQETMAGRIFVTVGFYAHVAPDAHGPSVGVQPAEKQRADGLHLHKIALADEILVLNIGGYIGSSTCREIAYARQAGKTIRFWEPVSADFLDTLPAFADLEAPTE